MPRRVLALTCTTSSSPPKASGTTPCCMSCWITRSGLASGLSILLMATMIGTFAAFGRG
jgi:hypothetical protein